MTSRDLVSASLRLVGALAPGEALQAAEATDGLAALNRMLGTWSTERLLIPSRIRETFALTATDASYTMGPTTGDFDTDRPQRIEAAAILKDNVEYPVRLLTQDEYAAIPDKTSTTQIPTTLYAEETFPLFTLNLWPVPSEVNDIVLYSWKPLDEYPDLSTDVSTAPGVDDALIQNLAIRLAPEYRRQVTPELVALAVESKAAIKRMNMRPSLLRVDDALLQSSKGFNIYTGGYR